ncbi:hypothetical protein HYC85_019042 [Camellia sinensis]|uniref:Pep3/Vps18 beta-propeller domain-containing protein n=1 Tax=Camellia sinensis TaxID=4442 RepID=A0A7J7GXH7_CAMSI|nr:hypothetical protein HYC85_019042 [Camellia sinensis]
MKLLLPKDPSHALALKEELVKGGSLDMVLELEILMKSIHRVFVDLGVSHCTATIVGGGGAETFYTHAKWIRPPFTREVILGTDNGQLHEIAVDEKDKKEKHINSLFELKELPEAFMGLQMETASTSNGTKYYVMAVTPTLFYSFSGIGSLDMNLIKSTIFASYVDRPVHFMELPGEIRNSELHFFIKQRRVVYFAWLSRAGIYHGGLNFGAQHRLYFFCSLLRKGSFYVHPRSCSTCWVVHQKEMKILVENKGLLDCSVSEFHFLLLLRNKVKVVNRISEQIIEELQFDETRESMSRGVIGLCNDASAGLLYAFDQNSIFQIVKKVSVNDEGLKYIDGVPGLEEYATALANCLDPFQKDQVYLAQLIIELFMMQAEAAFSAEDFLRAASFYAKMNL